ncbi:MAG: hypothetical protein N2Z81_01725 [Hydrogenothermaceae bacterium]|nr:hypothetical protein [Hydrogenothermaceae bacterium]
MEKVKDLQLISKLLTEINKLKGVKNLELIDVPEDVEADIGILLKLKKGYSWKDINKKISDLVWDIFEKNGEYIAVYREFKES